MEYCDKCDMYYSDTDEFKEGYCCDCKMNYIKFRQPPNCKEDRKNYVLEQGHCCKCKVNMIIADCESISGYLGINPSSNCEKHCCNCGIVYNNSYCHCCRCKKQYYYKGIHCCDCNKEYDEYKLFYNLQNAIKQKCKKIKTKRFDPDFEPLNQDDEDKHYNDFLVMDLKKKLKKSNDDENNFNDENDSNSSFSSDSNSDLDESDYALCICKFRDFEYNSDYD